MVQIMMVQVGIKLESQPEVMELCAYITSTKHRIAANQTIYAFWR